MASLTSQPYVIVAGKLAGIASVHELIAAARGKPRVLTFASTGVGTAPHLGIEEFNQAAGIKAVHIPAVQGEAIAEAGVASFDYPIWYNELRGSSMPPALKLNDHAVRSLAACSKSCGEYAESCGA